MMNKQYLKDTLAFVRFIHNNPAMDAGRKYHALISTLAHDLNGLINEERCFAPRVTGYAQAELREQMNNLKQQLVT